MARLGMKQSVNRQQASAILAQNHLRDVLQHNRGEEEGGFLSASEAAMFDQVVQKLDQLLNPDRKPAEGPARPKRGGSSGSTPAPQE